jgi:hypothetical protein
MDNYPSLDDMNTLWKYFDVSSPISLQLDSCVAELAARLRCERSVLDFSTVSLAVIEKHIFSIYEQTGFVDAYLYAPLSVYAAAYWSRLLGGAIFLDNELENPHVWGACLRLPDGRVMECYSTIHNDMFVSDLHGAYKMLVTGMEPFAETPPGCHGPGMGSQNQDCCFGWSYEATGDSPNASPDTE